MPHLAFMKTDISILSPGQVLLEDNHLLAVNKLPSQIVQGDKTGDIPLSEMAKEYLKNKYHKPGNVFMGVIHRLDRPVSGIVLFARTDKALSRMNELFRNREVQKKYWAVVRGAPPQEKGNLVHYLIKNERTNQSRIVAQTTKGALRSELNYTVLNKGDNYSLVEVELMTGRHHQIRVQLASLGTPVAGDVKYGDRRANDDKSICLHARELSFTHPVQQTPVCIQAPPPEQKYWDIFKPYINQ